MASGQAKNPYPISGNGLFVASPHIRLQCCYKNPGSVVVDLLNWRGNGIPALQALERLLKCSGECRALAGEGRTCWSYVHDLPSLGIYSQCQDPFLVTITQNSRVPREGKGRRGRHYANLERKMAR